MKLVFTIFAVFTITGFVNVSSTSPSGLGILSKVGESMQKVFYFLEEYVDACAKETKIDPQVVFDSKKFTDLSKEFMVCFLKKTETMDENGHLKKDTLIKMYPQREALMNKCAVDRTSAQETTYEFLKCLEDNLLQTTELPSSTTVASDS